MIWRKIGGNWQILFPPALASTSVGDDSSAGFCVCLLMCGCCDGVPPAHGSGFCVVVPVGYTLFAKIIRGNISHK